MSDPSPSPAPRAPWGRLTVSIGLLLLVGLMPIIGLPGVDTSAFLANAQPPRGIDVFALGVMPFISAAMLVELAAVVVRRWRPLRHGGPEGRAKLGRSTLFVAAVLCLFQGFGITKLLESLSLGTDLSSFSTPMVILTMTAGTFLLGLLSQLAGVYGIAGGLALLLVGLPLVDAAKTIARGQLQDLGSPRELAALVIPNVIVVAATWALLRAPQKAEEPDPREPTYRVAPTGDDPFPLVAIPSPASGLAPLVGAMTLVALPTTLRGTGAPTGWLATLLVHDSVQRAVTLVLIAPLAILAAWLFNAPHRVAALAARAGSGSTSSRAASELEAEARGRLREAVLRSVLYTVVLFAVGQVARPGQLWISPAAAAMATAITLDIAAEWRARRALADLVPIWPEHRPYALAAARAALAAAGIALHARGEHLRRLLQFGGAYAPIDLMVPRADAKRANKILKKLLLFQPDDEVITQAPAPAAPRWTRLESTLLAVTLLIAGGTMLLPGATSPLPQPSAPERPEALQLVPIDDETDAFDHAGDDLPRGVSIHLENAPVGGVRTAARHYARIVRAEDETLDHARERLVAWAAKRPLPERDRILVGPLAEYDEEKERSEQVGWRTYVAKKELIVDGNDVRGARAEPEMDVDRRSTRGWHVRVELDPEGAERFRVFTGANIGRRLAIIVDGKVESAPVIRSEIPGGIVVVTMGSGDPAQQLRDAQQLEKRLLGR